MHLDAVKRSLQRYRARASVFDAGKHKNKYNFDFVNTAA
jgi:hypothetical protein